MAGLVVVSVLVGLTGCSTWVKPGVTEEAMLHEGHLCDESVTASYGGWVMRHYEGVNAQMEVDQCMRDKGFRRMAK